MAGHGVRCIERGWVGEWVGVRVCALSECVRYAVCRVGCAVWGVSYAVRSLGHSLGRTLGQVQVCFVPPLSSLPPLILLSHVHTRVRAPGSLCLSLSPSLALSLARSRVYSTCLSLTFTFVRQGRCTTRTPHTKLRSLRHPPSMFGSVRACVRCSESASESHFRFWQGASCWARYFDSSKSDLWKPNPE